MESPGQTGPLLADLVLGDTDLGANVLLSVSIPVTEQAQAI